jgi:hypothetical protein
MISRIRSTRITRCVRSNGFPTENSENIEKSSDLPCPAVVSRGCSHTSRRLFHGSLVGLQPRGIGTRDHCAPPQLAALRRQRPGRTRLSAFDRLLWIWLYRVWPRCLNVMVLVKPTTVVQWHRQRFRFYWRWRSRSARPLVAPADRRLFCNRYAIVSRSLCQRLFDLDSAPSVLKFRLHSDSPQRTNSIAILAAV